MTAWSLVSVLAICSLCTQAEPPRARTEGGWVCGARREYRGFRYASFLGVPYAKQPLGALRFQELQPVEPWQGCLNATRQGRVCPQPTDSIFYRDFSLHNDIGEDCIHANIHVPLKYLPGRDCGVRGGCRGRPGLPVFVFIHGGAFSSGSGKVDLHGPQYLIQRDIIVITFNYRLGPLGFLSLASASVPGNAGLRDALSLLRWVRRNVRHFGGNPDDVTLGGQSSGSTAVQLLSLTDCTQGLFNKIVMMAGTAVRSSYSPFPEYAAQVAGEFLSRLSINSSDPEAAYRSLVHTPLHDIMAAQHEMIKERSPWVFTPVIDSGYPGVTPLIPADPEKLLASGRGSSLPLLMGFTDVGCESFRYRFVESHLIQNIKANHLKLAPPYLAYTTPEERLRSKVRSIVHGELHDRITLNEYVVYCSKASFICPALYVARKRVEKGGAPVYLYQFSYRGRYRVFEPHRPRVNSSHGEDLPYIFRTNAMPGGLICARERSRDYKMINFMTDLFANFIKTGNPVVNQSSCSPWPPTSASLALLRLRQPGIFEYVEPSAARIEDLRFFDRLYA